MNELRRELSEFGSPEPPRLPDDFARRVIRTASHRRERRQFERRVGLGAAAAMLILLALSPIMRVDEPQRPVSTEHTPILASGTPVVTTTDLARMDDPTRHSQDDLDNYLLPEARDDAEFDAYYLAQTHSVDYTGW